MAGTNNGAKAAALTNKRKYGEDFYVRIGAMGGKISRGGGFASMSKERLRELGRKGGTISRRGKK